MLLFATFNSSWEFLKWEAYGREFPSGRTHSSLTIASAILHRVIFFLFPSEVQFENSKKKKKIKETMKRNPKHKKITMKHNSEFKFLNRVLGNWGWISFLTYKTTGPPSSQSLLWLPAHLPRRDSWHFSNSPVQPLGSDDQHCTIFLDSNSPRNPQGKWTNTADGFLHLPS